MSQQSTHNDANPEGSNWRESIAQSFRSEEVRSIAKVLASLEPGATSASKTMLAMRFEESIFKAASNLEDYRKTIQKRIKRLQKHYAKQQKAAEAEGDGSNNIKAPENAELTREKELLFEAELRDKYASRLMYIANHADTAIAHTRQKNGEHKADVLQQHVANAKQWAVHLGLELSSVEDRKSYPRQPVRDMTFLNKLSTYLETRVDNIHSHVIKMTDPDLFLQDTLSKIDNVLLKDKVSEIYRKALIEADADHSDEFNEEQMKQLMERMNVHVPIPRRNQEGDQVRAAVARIEKIRAAAQALYIYMGLPLAAKTSFRGSIDKCHHVVMECMKELEGEYNNIVKEELDDKDEKGRRIIQLEDAWNNPLTFSELENEAEAETEPSVVEDAASGEEQQDTKRHKTENNGGKVPMVIRSRYLLTPGRNTFSTLLPALKRKKAVLVRNGSRTTYVKLQFGNAFEMTIYFVPLLVTVRAIPTDDEKLSMSSVSGGLSWPSLYQGLDHPSSNDKDSTTEANKSHHLNVLGVTGSYESIGPIIAKKLEYASSQATYVLRRCFAETTVGKSAMAKTEFEIEILEAGALIRFLQIARSTYIPDWVDDDS